MVKSMEASLTVTPNLRALFEDLFKTGIPGGDELRSMIKGGSNDTTTGQLAAETAPFIQ